MRAEKKQKKEQTKFFLSSYLTADYFLNCRILRDALRMSQFQLLHEMNKEWKRNKKSLWIIVQTKPTQNTAFVYLFIFLSARHHLIRAQ